MPGSMILPDLEIDIRPAADPVRERLVRPSDVPAVTVPRTVKERWGRR